jgi:hypothetical protein
MFFLLLRIANKWQISIDIDAGKVDDDDEKKGPPVIGRPELIEVPQLETDDDDDPEGLGFR